MDKPAIRFYNRSSLPSSPPNRAASDTLLQSSRGAVHLVVGHYYGPGARVALGAVPLATPAPCIAPTYILADWNFPLEGEGVYDSVADSTSAVASRTYGTFTPISEKP